MTTNAEEESVSSRVERLIEEYEQSREPENTTIGRQFAKLQITMIEKRETVPSNEGAKANNRSKNRYKDVLPYDEHRVILHSDENDDYINASFVQDFDGKPRYIAAQGPIDESVSDFLRMIWEYQITSVICTANEIEAGRFKFRRYWPDDDKPLQFGSYRVSKDETNEQAYRCEDYEIHPLIITQGENRRCILLYHFLHWLDHDVPNDEAPILDLLLRLDNDRNLSPETPILVHCSAGCGRTGSIIAIDLCRLLIQNERLLFNADFQSYPVYTIAIHIRQFRIALIQTLKQYLFVHKMFAFMMKKNGTNSLYSTVNNDENQALYSTPIAKSSPPPTSRHQSRQSMTKLNSPSVGRGIVNSNHHTPPNSLLSVVSASTNGNKLQVSDQPPPIPPRSSTVLHTTNKTLEGQFPLPGQTPVKAPRFLLRSRIVKGRETPVITTKNPRSDSADTLSASSSEPRVRHFTRRRFPLIPPEHTTNSD